MFIRTLSIPWCHNGSNHDLSAVGTRQFLAGDKTVAVMALGCLPWTVLCYNRELTHRLHYNNRLSDAAGLSNNHESGSGGRLLLSTAEKKAADVGTARKYNKSTFSPTND